MQNILDRPGLDRYEVVETVRIGIEQRFERRDVRHLFNQNQDTRATIEVQGATDFHLQNQRIINFY